MALDNTFTYSEPHARAWVFATAVKSFEHHEDFIMESRVDANSVVLYAKLPLAGIQPGGDMDTGWIFTSVFDRITYEIEEQLA